MTFFSCVSILIEGRKNNRIATKIFYPHYFIPNFYLLQLQPAVRKTANRPRGRASDTSQPDKSKILGGQTEHFNRNDQQPTPPLDLKAMQD